MKQSLIILICFFIIIACDPKAKIPKDVISRSKMTNILVDAYLVEAYLNNPKTMNKSDSLLSDTVYNYLYAIHKVKKQDVQYSLRFYIEHPQLLDEIYKDVIMELSRKDK